MKLKKGTIVAASICLFSVFLLWIGGYNFDERHPLLPIWAMATAFVAALGYVATENL